MTEHYQSTEPHERKTDDSDADAFAALSLLVIVAAAIAFYISH